MSTIDLRKLIDGMRPVLDSLTLSLLDFEPTCEFEDCDRPTAYLIECPQCSGVENICADCTTEVITHDSGFVFDRSCNHDFDTIRNCRFIPIGTP